MAECLWTFPRRVWLRDRINEARGRQSKPARCGGGGGAGEGESGGGGGGLAELLVRGEDSQSATRAADAEDDSDDSDLVD